VSQKILIVEDDLHIRESVQEILESENYEVLLAENGKAAMELLNERSEEVALIFLDLMMPVMDGPTLLAEIKTHTHWAKIPVVIFTAASDRYPGLSDGFMKKPIELDELLGFAEKYLPKN
jgi:DNA-binding response OmpR family regulator